MIIKIPSKNIYDIDNPKIRDNIIDNVNINGKKIFPKDEYEVSIYNDIVSPDYETIIDEDLQTQDSEYHYYPTSFDTPKYKIRAVGGYRLERKSQKSFNILIPKIQNNSYISTFNASSVEIGLRIKQTYGTDGSIIYMASNDTVQSPRIALLDEEILYKLKDFSFEQENLYIDRIDFAHDMEMQSKVSVGISGNMLKLQNYISSTWTGDSATIDLQESFPAITTPSIRVENVVDNGQECYKVSVSDFLVSLNAEFYDGIIASKNFEDGGAFEINLVKVKQELQEVTIRINGDKKGVSIEDITVVVGNGHKPFSIDGNELLQDSGKVAQKPITQHLAENILSQYKNGKETATILCNVGDYKDYDTDELKISTKSSDSSQLPMCFDIGDNVIPMVMGFDGQDRPMSSLTNGAPKVFEVCGVEMIYDGAILQKLHLQEIVV